MTRLSVFRILLAGILLTGTSYASTWKEDAAHSQVMFSVTHLVISEITGNFKDFDVTLTQGDTDFAGSTVEATIRTASVNTENEMRDRHLRSDDFFNAEKYPLITFKSTSFEKTGKDTYAIKGNLTIRDVTKPVVLEGKYLGKVTDARGNVKVGFKASTSINRLDYGVKWDKTIEAGGLVVSDKVDLTLHMEFQEQK
jgi:polyisoprenoid-binding protein YceI